MFAFSPSRGGEPAVGWNLATRISQYADVTVLYGDVRGDRRARREMDAYTTMHALPARMRAIYVEPTPWMSLLERLHSLPASWMLYYMAYRQWQKNAFMTAARLHAEEPFDIAHQLTYIGYREPGNLWELGIPFVWGPISGAENIPAAFYRTFRPAEMFRPLSRDLGNHLQSAFPGRIRSAAQTASKIFAVSSAEEKLLARWGVRCERLLETGTTPKAIARVRMRTISPLRIVWSGLFTARKAFPILIHALKRWNPPADKWSLCVLGDGPLNELWRAEYQSAGLPEGNVCWRGRVSHSEAIALMGEGDVLVHTGLREGTPHVVLEALSMGMPVICHDAGGMGTAVDETSGIRIPLKDFQTSVEHLAAALHRFLNEASLLQTLSEGALRRAGELSWDAIAKKLHHTYREILSL